MQAHLTFKSEAQLEEKVKDAFAARGPGQPYLVPGSRLPKGAVSAPSFARRPTRKPETEKSRRPARAVAGRRWFLPALPYAAILSAWGVAMCRATTRFGSCSHPSSACDGRASVLRLRGNQLRQLMRTESRHAYSCAVGQQSREREQRGDAREDQRAACRCGSRARNMLGSLLVAMMADERRPNLTARSSI